MKKVALSPKLRPVLSAILLRGFELYLKRLANMSSSLTGLGVRLRVAASCEANVAPCEEVDATANGSLSVNDCCCKHLHALYFIGGLSNASTMG